MSFDITGSIKKRAIYYLVDSDIRVGIGVEAARKGVLVDTVDGLRRVEEKDILAVSRDQLGSPAEADDRLNTIRSRDIMAEVETAWELVSDQAQAMTFDELASLCGLDESGLTLDALALALVSPDSPFKEKDKRFVPLPQKLVQEKRLQRQKAAERRRQFEATLAELRQMPESETQTLSREARTAIAAVEQQVLVPDTPNALGLRVLDGLLPGDSRPVQQRGLDLLVRLGIWDEHEDINLRRLDVHTTFPQAVMNQVPQIVAQTGQRADQLSSAGQRHQVFSFAIDDVETTDVDDALSVEPLDDGLRIHVLIADVASAVAEGTPVDTEARRRAATVYHPVDRFHMLPPELSSKALSLTIGEPRLALDHCFVLKADASIADFTVTPTVLVLDKRLTYDEADSLLAAPDGSAAGVGLKLLAQAVLRLRELRYSRGAVSFYPIEIRAKVVDGRVVRKVARTDTPSRMLVSELMVTACSMAGSWLVSRNGPAPYRVQPRPDEDLGWTPAKATDPVFMHTAMRKLRKAELTTHPGAHASLGVSAYTQCTSPLRRYLDLVVQRQLLAILERGSPHYDQAAMVQVMGTCETTANLARRAGEEADRYWLCVGLKECVGQEHEAIVLAAERDSALLMLTQWGLHARIRGNIVPPPGTAVRVLVSAVNPRAEAVSVRLLN